MRSGDPIKVAHLVSHPVQYFAPLYRELAGRREIDLTVFFYSDTTARSFHDPGFAREIAWEDDLLEGYRSRVCRSARGPSVGSPLRPHLDVVREVASGRFGVVWAHGYSHVVTWLALVAARATGARLLVREEQTLLKPRSVLRRALKHGALRILFSQVDGLYIGEENRRYFQHYGMPPERLFPARYCVDNTRFQTAADRLSAGRDELRAGFGIGDDAPVVLFCGKLTEDKQPLLLLDAFAKLVERRPAWLLLVGDGPLRDAVDRRCLALGLGRVLRTGFLNQSRLLEAYAAADVLVLPSQRETWGLAVNEALNFGLPVVASDRVGAGADLVRPQWNGTVFPHDDPDALVDALDELVASPALRSAYGQRGRAIVERYTIEACADGIVAACLGRPAPTALAREGAPA